MKNRDRFRGLFLHYCMMLLIIALATGLGIALQELNVRAENIIMVYIVALLIIIVEYKRAVYGVASAVIMVVLYNFLFIEPRNSFSLDDYNDWVITVGFLVVAVVINTLVHRMQVQIERSDRNEKRMKNLFAFSQGLTAVSGEEIVVYGRETVEELTGRAVLFVSPNGERTGEEEAFDCDALAHEIEWCKKNNRVCGYRENRFPDLSVKLLPLAGSTDSLGVLLVDCSDGDFDKEERAFLLALTSQFAIALDREDVSAEAEA